MAMVVNFNVPVEKVFSWCFPEPGLPERRTLQNLKDDWNMLKAARDQTNTKIQESPNMRTLPEVTLWLQQVESLGLRVETLITDYTRESVNQCFYGFFPKNCKKRFNLWKQVSPMDYEVRDLLSQQKEVVAETPLVPSAQLVPTDSTTPYIQNMVDEIWIHIENEQDVGLIGLYGMGGIGKTTILKAIHNKLCSSTQLFELQLGMIVVSKTPNLDAIQNHVGKKIGFRGDDWKSNSRDEKAQDIFSVLREKKYILLLDDIWERFDLTKIGISHECLKTKSKVIFTTRYKQVCGQMQGIKIQVKCLQTKEAWDLFQEKVGEETLKAHPDILKLAKDVARECGGLPLAVIVLGRAMTCKKTKHEWEHAIRVLKKGNVGQSSTMMDEVFTPLKYSFDNLSNDTIRSCLLYCSLYPEDHLCFKSEVIEKWICEDFMGEPNDPHKDRINEGHDIIRTLVNACLLEEYVTNDHVKMHDVIRDMMIHIGGNKYCVMAAAGVTQIPNDVKWEHVERMSLMNNPIVELDGRPTECPNLKTMFLADAQLSSIKIDFSKFVPNLKVLDLSVNPNLTSLPNGICELVNLEYLNLCGCDIREIPLELKKLVKLKYLNLVFTIISEIPEGILSSLKQLYVFRWASTGVAARSRDFLSEKLVKELEGLSYLQELSMSAHSKVDISHLTSSVKLLSCITGLTLADFNDSNSLNILFLIEMKHLRDLYIVDLEKVEKIVVGEEGLEISAMNFQNGFNTCLQYLTITGCRQLKNLSWLVFFPNIDSLIVDACPEMQTLVSENEYNLDNELQPFKKLGLLYLEDLPKLENIYATPLSFPLLCHLEVRSGCNRLKKLPLDSSSICESGEMVIKGHQQWWDELQWEDEATRITFSPRFRPFAT